MAEVADRIIVNPEQCGGRPCIRGLRIRVIGVLDLLASGLTTEQILEEFPDLEAEDIAACLRYASRRIDQPVLAACLPGHGSSRCARMARRRRIVGRAPRRV